MLDVVDVSLYADGRHLPLPPSDEGGVFAAGKDGGRDTEKQI